MADPATHALLFENTVEAVLFLHGLEGAAFLAGPAGRAASGIDHGPEAAGVVDLGPERDHDRQRLAAAGTTVTDEMAGVGLVDGHMYQAFLLTLP